MLRTPCSLAVIVLCALPSLAGAQTCPKLEGGLPVVGSSPPLRACPTQVMNLDVDGDSGIFSGVCQIERKGDYAYLLSDDSIYVLDVSAPPAPVVIERVVPPGGHWCFDMQLVGDRLYIAEGREGLAVWDVSTPASPVLAGSVGADQYVSAVVVRGTTAYLSGFGLRIFDVIDLADPMKLGELESTSPSGAVAVTGELVLLSGTRGVQIVDVTDPAAPVERSVILAGGDDYAFAGTLAYVVGSGGLATYDLSDPTSPVLVGSYDLVSLARAVLVDGDVAYVGSSYPNRLDVLSIADPAAPQLIGSADVGGWDLELVDGLLYDPFGDGLKVFDVDSCFETESSLWVPIAAHVDGLWGSSWRTDLVLFNEGEERANVQLVLHADDGQHELDGAVEAGSQGVFEDVVGLMEAATKGLLEVRSETSLRGVSRTFEAAEPGPVCSRAGRTTVGHQAADAMPACEPKPRGVVPVTLFQRTG